MDTDNLLTDNNVEDFVNISKTWFNKKRSKIDKIGCLVNISHYFQHLNKLSNKNYKTQDIEKDYLDMMSSSQITRLFNNFRKYYKTNLRNRKNRKSLVKSINDTHYQFMELYDELMKNDENEDVIGANNLPQQPEIKNTDQLENISSNISHKQLPPPPPPRPIIKNEPIPQQPPTPEPIPPSPKSPTELTPDNSPSPEPEPSNRGSFSPKSPTQKTPDNSPPPEEDNSPDEDIPDINHENINTNNFTFNNKYIRTCDGCDKERQSLYHHNNKDLDICLECVGTRRGNGRAYKLLSRNLKKNITKNEYNDLVKYHRNKN